MVLIVRHSDATSSTISLSAYFERWRSEVRIVEDSKEVVQNKYKIIQGKKAKTAIFTCN